MRKPPLIVSHTVPVHSLSLSNRTVHTSKRAEAYMNRVVVQFSVCSLRPAASVAPGKLERNADSQAHPRLIESDILGVGPSRSVLQQASR